jgi:uncharacterized protein (UPF0332 family)
MTGSKSDLVNYRLSRAWDTLDDARILAEKEKWNSAINRLYYAAYYAVIALLLNADLKSTTHSGTKSVFSQEFISKKIISRDLGKIYSQLFTWRQKGDFDDLFDFKKEKVLPYFEPVKSLIETIESFITKSSSNSNKT